VFAGHLGAGLGLGALAPRRSPGAIVLAAFALDVVLWVLVLAGIERVVVPEDYARRHFLTFFFPYSHGLAATLLWSLAAYLVAGRGRWGRLAAAAVASHFVLDAIVHVPEMPLLGARSPELGLGLWRHMGIALTLEAAITLTGLGAYVKLARPPRARAVGLGLVALLVLGMTVAGQTIAPAPPSASAAAVSGLGAIVLVSALVGWLARGAPPAPRR
jgi:hypothetical protein